MAASSRSWRATSAEAMVDFGAELGSRIPAGTVIALEGEMGAGKTTFVRGLARGLGSEDPVTSPTFTLMHEYRGRLRLLHFDAFMESRERSFLADGGADGIGGEAVAAIEWSERISDWLPEPYLHLRMWHLDAETRGLELRAVGSGPLGTALEAFLEGIGPVAGVPEAESA